MIPHKIDFEVKDDNVRDEQLGDRAREIIRNVGNIGEVHPLLLWLKEKDPCDSPSSPELPPAA